MRRMLIHTSVLRSLSLFGLVLAAGCASADPDAGFDESTGSVGEAVDLTAINANQIAIVQDSSKPAKSTGVVYVPFLTSATDHTPQTVYSSQYGTLPVRGSCGITFVSPRYAITSSHCFDKFNAYDPANQTFNAQSFDLSTANRDDFYFDAAMTGSFPNYTPIFGHTMNQAAGYNVSNYQCKIVSRCAYLPANATSYNCDAPISASDVTMLYCGNRPNATGNWLPIASDNSTSGNVFMYWFHELFMVNNNPDAITHYTNIPSGDASNWHYIGAPTNQFLPFKSVPFASGAQRRRLGSVSEGAMLTDLYGCHGTSGSGVLAMDANGNYSLLGPVHTAASGWGSGKLCDDPAALTSGGPGGHGLTFNLNSSVNSLVNPKYTTTLAADRTWLVVNPRPVPTVFQPIQTVGSEP